jgi:DNA-binding NtrC family response regulator
MSQTVLVVDDDLAILASLAQILEQQGYKVETAATGYEAIEKCKKGSYDLALLDIRLPDIDGTQLLKELNSICVTMIKIMVTGYAGLDSAVQSLLLGANAYVMKPVEPDELLKVVAEALSERQTR